MDRSLWLSLLLVALSMALVITGRTAMDVAQTAHASALVAEIDGLAGAPAATDLAERVTESAGCIYGFRPPVRSCWYVWAEPTRADYLRVVAERVRADAMREAALFGLVAVVLWAAVAITAWKATRPRPPYRPPRIVRSVRVDPPPRRLVP